MRYVLDLPSMKARHKVEQVKAYPSVMQTLKNPLHDTVKEEKGFRLARGKSWRATQNNQSGMCAVSLSSSK